MEQPNNLIDQHARYFVYRSTPRADVIANTNNILQERTERTRLGIPAVLISNPRNHFTMIADITDFKKQKITMYPQKMDLVNFPYGQIL
ncbi:hypothetical protein V7306_29205 [Neobacillus vireti]